MWILKKLIAPLFFPVPLVLEVMCLGLVLLWFSKRQRLGKILVTTAAVALTILSSGLVANLLLAPLERAYPSLETAEQGVELPDGIERIDYVVVLGGGHVSDPALPVTSQIADGALVRLVEGVRLHRLLAGSKLVVSGGAVFDPVPHARVMASVARQLGVAPADLVLEEESRDTRHEAELLQPLLGSRPFVLVTSASHMPRSVALFRALGMQPLAAPVGHRVKRSGRIVPGALFPGAGQLQKSTTAVYEYLGLTWAKLRGFL